MPEADADLIPNDGSWLLIDTTDGWTLDGGAARLVPALAGEEADLLLAPESTSERLAYAERVGVPLGFPKAPGWPLSDLDGDYWLVSTDNGDFIEDVTVVVLVEATGEGEFDNTEEGCEAALRYVEVLGR